MLIFYWKQVHLSLYKQQTSQGTHFIKFSRHKRSPPTVSIRNPQFTNPVKSVNLELHENKESRGLCILKIYCQFIYNKIILLLYVKRYLYGLAGYVLHQITTSKLENLICNKLIAITKFVWALFRLYWKSFWWKKHYNIPTSLTNFLFPKTNNLLEFYSKWQVFPCKLYEITDK